MAVTLWVQGTWWLASITPVSDYFEASVSVPNFKAGEDPLVVYDRQIKITFTGGFVVEVKSVEGASTACFGGLSGVRYTAGEVLDPTVPTLTWYVANPRDCTKSLKPGRYYLETNYTISSENSPDKHLTTVSNVFTVLDPNAAGA